MAVEGQQRERLKQALLRLLRLTNKPLNEAPNLLIAEINRQQTQEEPDTAPSRAAE